MRKLKLIAITCLILAIGTSAWAKAIPLDPPDWEGEVYMHMVDYMMGTI